jgi:enamine deaminase RidA (YjgF/YER057c/UK114 family)
MIPGGCSDSGGRVQGRAEEAIVEKRRSIDVAGARHVNPIPSASRKGPFVASGAISGADPATGKVPEDLDAQCAAMFANVRRVIETAGGTPDDIIKMTVWITDRALRPILNKYWVEMFPDPHSRPARHTVASGDFTPPMQVQCDLLAVIG